MHDAALSSCGHPTFMTSLDSIHDTATLDGANPRSVTARVTARITVALCLALASLIAPLAAGSGPTAHAARTWVVAPWGDNSADGSATDPLKTVGWAVARARSGDTIVLRGGVYREQVQVYRKTLHIRSQAGERAVFDGAVTVDTWTSSGGDWYSSGWTQQFYREPSGGVVDGANIAAGYPDQMFIDGRTLTQVLQRSEVRPGTFFHDTDADRLWIGDDPSGAIVEASKLRFGLYFNHADGSTLTDVTVRRYATEARHMAAIRAYSNNLVFSGVTSELNARIGISAIGSGIVIRDSRFVDNGHLGVHGDRLTTFVVERTAVKGNNKAGFDTGHSAGGLKVTSSRGVTVRDSDVSRNNGPGIWTDLDTEYVTISRNLVERNGRAGIEIELSRKVNVLGNVTLDNGEAGIWVLESQDVQVLHNASYDSKNAIEVEEGPRRDVRNVRVFNNVLARGKGGSLALLAVNDWTEERSASQMGVRTGYNAYWVPSTSKTSYLSRWGRWPSSPAYSQDLREHQQVTGQGVGSLVDTSGSNPFVRSSEDLDYRSPSTTAAGTAVSGSAAAELGVPNGSRPRIGPLSVVVRR